MAAVAPWRLYKQIYSFPVEMEQLLYEQADDCKLPVDVLRNLPYPCIYVETALSDFDGFFFHFESDANNGNLEMRFLHLNTEGKEIKTFALPIHIVPGGTIKDGIDAAVKQSQEEYKKRYGSKDSKFQNISDLRDDDSYCRDVYKYVQLVLYICAQNREITEDEAQRRTYRKPKSEEYIKDKYREIQKWNMGTETARTIRNMKRNPVRYQYTGESAETGTPKSPHVRRGHWHHYWTGAGNNDERKQILKWIPPTFVNADKVEETNVVTCNRM